MIAAIVVPLWALPVAYFVGLLVFGTIFSYLAGRHYNDDQHKGAAEFFCNKHSIWCSSEFPLQLIILGWPLATVLFAFVFLVLYPIYGGIMLITKGLLLPLSTWFTRVSRAPYAARQVLNQHPTAVPVDKPKDMSDL